MSLSKKPGAAAPKSRPRIVTLAVIALGVCALGALVAALALLGQHDWVKQTQITANRSASSSAVSQAVAQASSAHADVAKASASATSAAATKYPTSGSHLHDQVNQQQQAVLVGTVFVVVVIAFLAYGAYRGRHWSRWAIVAFWLIASFIGTLAGVGSILNIASGQPAVYKVPAFVSGLSLLVAVVLVNMGQSTQYFAQSRPARAAGGPRGGLFTPRPPQRTRPGSPAAGVKGAFTSNAATRGEAYVQKQRAKKRTGAEGVAKGAELARSRAKASKSRRNSEQS